jgi:Tfp pilus assembly protein PilO
MVGMMSFRRTSLRVIDLLGGSLVASCLFVFVWVTALQPNQTQAQIEELVRRVDKAQRDLAAPVADTARQRLLLEEYREKLERLGQLPDGVDIESYFQHLSQLSDHHNLRVVRQEPLSRQIYPGLSEERYAYDVVGVFPDILAFLKSIEETDYWADVSYLKVEQRTQSKTQTGRERVASLVISLFSARTDQQAGIERNE